MQYHTFSPSGTAATKVSAIFKITFYGPSCAGKSLLFSRFVTIGDSSKGPVPATLPSVPSLTTIGADFCLYDYVHDNDNFKLQLWDTGGQERFRSVATGYLRSSVVIFVAFDLADLYLHLCETNPKLLNADNLAERLHDRCSEWLAATRKGALQTVTAACSNGLISLSGGPLVAIIGNKTDMCKRLGTVAELERLREAMRKLASQYSAEYFETSALTGAGVRTLVDWLVSALHTVYVDNLRLARASTASATSSSPTAAPSSKIVRLYAAPPSRADTAQQDAPVCGC